MGLTKPTILLAFLFGSAFLYAKDQPSCVQDVLSSEMGTFSALMDGKEMKNCSLPNQDVVNKCKRTCFTDFTPLEKTEGTFWDKFTRKLIKEGQHFQLKDSRLGNINIVIQKGYLTETEVARFCEDLGANFAKAMDLLGNTNTPKELTIYLYDEDPNNPQNSPPSYGNAPGLKLGSKGITSKFAKSQGDPTIHEFIHVCNLHQQDSESLSEGLPEYIQYKIQPDLAVGLNAGRAVVNPDEEALKLIEQFEKEYDTYPDYINKDCRKINILETIGANFTPRFALDDDDKKSHENCFFVTDRSLIGLNNGNAVVYKQKYRRGFYHASHSFVRYLVEQRGGMEKFKKMYDAGGTPESYQKTYGTDVSSMRADWLAFIKSKKK